MLHNRCSCNLEDHVLCMGSYWQSSNCSDVELGGGWHSNPFVYNNNNIIIMSSY